jgi:CubicO group peptidase (beta-lactamase class C family)
MRTPWWLTIVFAFLLPFAPSAAAQELQGKADNSVHAIERIIRSTVASDGPGAAVLVIKDGEVILKKGYGLADLDAKTPVTGETTFELASGSKPITSLAILLLELMGKLALTDDVRKYVPELPEYDKNRPIRLADLLAHTSGLPDPISSGQIRDKTSDDLLNWVKERKLLFKTGSKFQYSNMNYRLLSIVVERVSGKSLGAFLQAEVFGPLEMKRTVVRESKETHIPSRAKGYTRGGLLDAGQKYRFLENDFVLSGEAGIWSCIDDLERLDRGLRSGKVLKAETLARAWSPTKLDTGSDSNYGLGWFINQGKQGLKVYHSGGWPGFTSYHLRYVDKKISVFVLRNFYGDTSSTQLAERVGNLLLQAKPPAGIALPDTDRERLVGAYESDKRAKTAKVVEGPEGLALHLANQIPYPLIALSKTRFQLLGAPDGYVANFKLDEEKVHSLTVEQADDRPAVVFLPRLARKNLNAKFDQQTAAKVVGPVWLGVLPLSAGAKDSLRIAFQFSLDEGVLSGRLDNPDQGIIGVVLGKVRLEDSSVQFEWSAIQASFEGTLNDDATEIVGHWLQSGRKTPLTFKKVK